MRLTLFFGILPCFFASAQGPTTTISYAPELFSPNASGAVCGFSSDGKVIYFVREDTTSHELHLFQANREGNEWRNAKLLPFSGIGNDYGGRLAADGETFYFTSDRPGGSSKHGDAWNIWKAVLENGAWLSPSPLGAVNDGGMECCPLPLPDGSLIFSADRNDQRAWWISSINGSAESLVMELNHANAWQWPSSTNRKGDILFLNSMKRPDTQGMDDLYVSFLRTDGKWSQPLNMGPTVNTKEYEDGAILTPDEEWLIFCRHATASLLRECWR